MTTTIIGLTGYAGSGKSTVARHLEHRYGFTILSFASALKEMIERINPILGVSDNGAPIHFDEARSLYPDEVELKSNFPEYRRFMQYLGTEGIRSIDGDFWVKQLARKVEQEKHRGATKFVVDDVRFVNEASMIKANERHKLVNVRNPWKLPVHKHISEQMVGHMGEEYTLYNDGDIPTLHKFTDHLMAIHFPDLHPTN